MRVSDRIQWFHKKVSERCFPNAAHLAEKFEISHRQAQRDVEYLKNKLGAPLEYSSMNKGYYYSTRFVLPFIMDNESNTDFQDVLSGINRFRNSMAEQSAIQLQLPYSAILEITDRLTVMNLRSFIVGEEAHHRYRCEFPSVELFLGIIMSTGAEIKVVSPDWLRTRLVEFAHRVLRNNEEPTDEIDE